LRTPVDPAALAGRACNSAIVTARCAIRCRESSAIIADLSA
jgi:hypothetical protein